VGVDGTNSEFGGSGWLGTPAAEVSENFTPTIPLESKT
jgi:hypothetical protein